MKKGFTRIRVLVDRSGSMKRIAAATVSGINEFITAQKAQPGDAELDVIQFDEDGGKLTYETILKGNLKSIATITDEQFDPRGMTPLHDAMGRTINELGAELAALPESERPEKVIVTFVTDGLENASKEFKADQIKAMVEHQTSKYNWSFSYVGANQDAVLVGQELGFSPLRCMSFTSDSVHTKSAFSAVAAYASSVRSADLHDVQKMGYTDADRASSLDENDPVAQGVSSNNATKIPFVPKSRGPIKTGIPFVPKDNQ
jgi:hypothetical protein